MRLPSFTEFFSTSNGWLDVTDFFYTEFLYGGVAFWFQLRKLFLVVFFLLFFLGFFDFQQSASFFFNGAQPTGSRPLRKSAATVSFFFCAFFLRVSGAKKQQQQQHKKKRKKKERARAPSSQLVISRRFYGELEILFAKKKSFFLQSKLLAGSPSKSSSWNVGATHFCCCRKLGKKELGWKSWWQ